MEETAAAVNTAMAAATTATMIGSFFLGGALYQLMSLIKQLQLMTMQSIVAIVYPAELTMFYGIVIKFAGIDLLNGPLWYDMWFTF